MVADIPTGFLEAMRDELPTDMDLRQSQAARALADYLADHDDPLAIVLQRAIGAAPKTSSPVQWCGPVWMLEGGAVRIEYTAPWPSAARVTIRLSVPGRGIATAQANVTAAELRAIARPETLDNRDEFERYIQE